MAKRWKTAVPRCMIAGILYFITFFKNIRFNQETLSQQSLAIQQFGGILSIDVNNLMYSLIELTPIIFFIYIFSSYFQQDFQINYVYVFTRAGSRSAWLLKKTGELFLENFVAWLVAFLVTAFLGMCFGAQANGEFLAYLKIFLCNLCPVFLFCFLQNVLSLKIGRTASFVVVAVGIYLFCLMIGLVLYPYSEGLAWVYRILPATGNMYAWHDGLSYPQEIAEGILEPVKGFYIWQSLISCLIWFIVSFGLAVFIINRGDLFNMIKEDD